MIPYVVSIPQGHPRIRIGEVPYLAAMASHPEDSDKWEGQEKRFKHLVLKVWHRVGDEWPDSDAQAAIVVKRVIQGDSQDLTPHQLIHLFLASLYKKRVMQAVQHGRLTIKRHARPIEEMDVAPDERGWQSFRDGDWVTTDDLSAWLADFGIEVREKAGEAAAQNHSTQQIKTERGQPNQPPHQSPSGPERNPNDRRVEWIKEVLIELGHDPHNPPDSPPGKGGVKKQIREIMHKKSPECFRAAYRSNFKEGPMNRAFDRAWLTLRKEAKHPQNGRP